MEFEHNLNATIDGIFIPASTGPSTKLATWISDIGSPPVLTIVAALWLTISSRNAAAWWSAGIYILAAVGVPSAYIGWLFQQGIINDLHLPVRSERIKPMLVTLIMAGLVWSGFLIFHAEPYLQALAAVGLLQAMVFLGITLWWKVSTHSAAAATLTVIAVFLGGIGAIWVALSVPLIVWARVRLRRHTLLQTIIGTTLGLGLTTAVFLTAL